MNEQLRSNALKRLQLWEDDFRQVSDRLAGATGDAERRTTIADFVDRCEDTIREIDASLNPSSRTDLRLTKAAAEIELAKLEAEPQRGRLIERAAATCSAATEISLASGVTFEPAETISRSLALLAIAVSIAKEEQQVQLNSQARQHVGCLSAVLTQMDADQTAAMRAIMTGALLLDSLAETERVESRQHIIDGSVGFARQALHLAASTANHDLRRQAQRLLTDSDAARRQLMTSASPSETNSGRIRCPSCGSAAQANARFCAQCGLRLPP